MSGTLSILRLPPEQAPRDALHASVGLLRALAHDARHLLREPRALVRYRLGHRRAARHLVDEHPEFLALDQARYGLVEQLALDHARDEPLRLRAVEHAVAEARGAGALERGRHDPLELGPVEEPLRDVV